MGSHEGPESLVERSAAEAGKSAGRHASLNGDKADGGGALLPASLTFPTGTFNELTFRYDPNLQTAWSMMRPAGTPRFTPALLRELNLLHAKMALAADPKQNPLAARPKFYVGGSALKGVFNLGGDLAYFVECIRTQNEEGLRDYAHACVNISHDLDNGLGGRIVTICVVQGDALGGGLEGALSFNILIAERGSKMGLPETLFNTFPGMGAYSILMRKIGPVKAQEMILGGKLYTAEELHAMGLVTILAEPGGGMEAAREFIRTNARRQELLLAIGKVRRRIQPVTIEELEDVTDIWVETSLNLGAADLRKMEILLNAQAKKNASLERI